MIQRLMESVLLSSSGQEPGKGARLKVVDCENEEIVTSQLQHHENSDICKILQS